MRKPIIFSERLKYVIWSKQVFEKSMWKGPWLLEWLFRRAWQNVEDGRDDH